ncbi:MAG: alpha/beta hydrolase [Cellulomonas sp.]|jgi:pimeloyl-ACP methyl ester carboxylesterase|nr:alpha/beta hydrolase [Cellulomonas sp.]
MTTMDPGAVDASVLLVDGPWRHRFVTANGSRFHVAVAGPDEREAPLVVLLHSVLGFWWSWRHQLVALADAGYRVAAMDLRGTGASDKPPSGYDVPTLVADVSGVVRSLGADDAVVVGTGTGGDVAWAVPALAGDVARAVAVLAAPRPIDPDGTTRYSTTARAARFLVYAQVPGLPERSLTRGDLLSRLLDAWGGVPGWPDAETLAVYRDALRVPFAAHSQLEQLRWLTRSPSRADGARLRAALLEARPVPVLQVHGAHDGLRSGRQALSTAEAARYTTAYRFETVTAAGHFPAEQAPGLVSTLLTDWLSGVAPVP